MRDDASRLNDILRAARLIEEFLKGKTREDLETDRLLQSGLLHQLYVIGEAAGRVSDVLKRANTGIPWKIIYGFRNHIAHEYFSLDLDIVWQTACHDIPALENQIREIVGKPNP